jgi:signal transduction histidine kinase
MDFSRPARPEFSLCALEELLKKTVAEQSQVMTARGVALDLDVEPGVPAVQADGEKLKQVILNLIRNAAEAMPAGGGIGLALRRAGANVEIAVADTGPGIPAKLIEKIFSPFFTTKPDGTGLGLALSRKIVEDHGGKITVKSEPGQGSVFTMVLPIEHPPETVTDADLHETKELLRAEGLEEAGERPVDGARRPATQP